MDTDRNYILKTVELADKNISLHNGGPFGAIIVKNGEIISKGVNRVSSNNDPTAHAEINAIREACSKLETFQLDDCTIYSSCEPCPMCLSAIYWARIDKVVFGASKLDAEEAGFIDSEIYEELNKTPESRKIKTINIDVPEAKNVFRKWIDMENKIEY